MNLIDDVSEKIVAEFRRLWPYQKQVEFFRSREIAKEGEFFRKLAEMSEKERQSAIDAGMTPERALDAAKAKVADAADNEVDYVAQKALFVEVGNNISDQLNRLSPDTYPEEDAETTGKMVDFLTQFSKAYSKEGKQRSAGPILEYILAADYDHAWWLWDKWIGACIAVGDHESAEGLIAAATDGSTPASTTFARGGGRFKPKIMVAKAVIALRRDGDLELAHTIANAARLSFGESRDAIRCFRGIEHIRQEVAKGGCAIEMNTGPNGGVVHEIVNKRVPAAALLTGKWD